MHRASRREESSGHVLQSFSWVGNLEPEVGGQRKGGRRRGSFGCVLSDAGRAAQSDAVKGKPEAHPGGALGA